MNPMIRKELKHRMRDRRGWLLPLLYLLALGAAVALGYFFSTWEMWGFDFQGERQGADIGVVVFWTVTITQMALLLLLAPAFTAGALTIEKEQRTMGGLLTSLLTPAQIWWGKFASSILFLLLLLFTGVPVMSLAFSLGGVGPKELAEVAGITFVVLGCFCAVGLYCSSYFRRSVHATAVTYGVTIALTVLTWVAASILQFAAYSREQMMAGKHPPWYAEFPLYLNPFTPLSVVGDGREELYPSWLLSLLLFLAVWCLATAFALRNIERGGEQV